MHEEMIKMYLSHLISEEKPVGLSTTEKVQGIDSKTNKEAMKDVKKKMTDYSKASEAKDKNAVKPVMNANSKKEAEFIEDSQQLGGMQALQYDNEPNEAFVERQKMAIEGDSKMGNKTYTGEENGNTEPVWGASTADLGKKIVATTKRAKERTDAATPNITSFGDDIEMGGNKSIKRKVAVESTNKKINALKEGDIDEISGDLKKRAFDAANSKYKTQSGGDSSGQDRDVNYLDKVKSLSQANAFSSHINPDIKKAVIGVGDKLNLKTSINKVTDDNRAPVTIYYGDNKLLNIDVSNYTIAIYIKKDSYKIDTKGVSVPTLIPEPIQRMLVRLIKTIQNNEIGNNTEVTENKENNINETKTKMKRLRFKKPFNGMDNALKLIPESYKEDRKEFEMTDNNETYKVRWEGSLTEGKGIVLQEANQHFINEDMAKIKHLMGYNSKSTLGTLKGADRITENAKFDDIWSKSKTLVSEATKDNKKPVISEAKQELNNLEKGKLALWTKKAGFNEPTK